MERLRKEGENKKRMATDEDREQAARFFRFIGIEPTATQIEALARRDVGESYLRQTPEQRARVAELNAAAERQGKR